MTRMEDGVNNEESASQMVQKEQAVMKYEIKNLKMGSGSTVCSETSRVRTGLRKRFGCF